MGDGAEFDLIRSMVARWGSLARGIGDDAALLDVPAGHRLVASVDAAVDGVHFRRAWLTPAEIGYRATAAAMSDLAAMAATPIAVLVALSLPTAWLESITEVAEGIGEMTKAAGAIIAGGNVTRAPVFSITTTVLGSVAQPLERSGARARDRIYVTGSLGGPGAALRAFNAGRMPDEAHHRRFGHPVPRLAEARWLGRAGATAAIDISDGLLADLGHLAAASRVRLSIDLDRLPVVAGEDALTAAGSGEEYELAIAARGPIDAAAFEREFGVPLTEIGVAVEGSPAVDATLAGERVARTAGHDHLSR